MIVTTAPKLRATVQWLSEKKRLHLNDGPIDLIVEANGAQTEIKRAYDAAISRFETILDELCGELLELRKQALSAYSPLRGPIARRMYDAVAPFAVTNFVTPMAAVAGSVAEEVLQTMKREADLDRAYVNNGGDIACHLTPGRSYSLALVDRPAFNARINRAVIPFDAQISGIATSGRHGRSFSLGIADAVTIFARSAPAADAAATIVANAVDLPKNPGIVRRPANVIDPNSDLGERLVVRDVPALKIDEINEALDAGAHVANQCIEDGLIDAAILQLNGFVRTHMQCNSLLSVQNPGADVLRLTQFLSVPPVNHRNI